MNRTAWILSVFVLGLVAVSRAGTFDPVPYLADAQVDVLSERLAIDEFGRSLLEQPYATVVVGNVDVYDRFPYLEAHYFQIVSDPAWNRLLAGEVGRGLSAFDGSATPFGALRSPRGLSNDAMGRIYVADTGNDRVLVLQTSSEFDRVELRPLCAIDGLSEPYDVAYSDGGTPFEEGDDRLYIANTGRSEVLRYELGSKEARLTARVGELGSGTGAFAGPMAVAVGRMDGRSTGVVYVADAHNERVVRLRDTGHSLAWESETPNDLGLVTSLETDHWGNVYAAGPQIDRIVKYAPDLYPVASYSGGIERPRSFHPVFANVTDHRTGERRRSGEGTGVLVEEWRGESGIRLMNLGVEIADATPVEGEVAAARVTLTDRARVTAVITDPRTGSVIARHDAGSLDAGMQLIRFADEDFSEGRDEGAYRMTVRAVSTYDEGRAAERAMEVELPEAASPALPERLTLYGNSPNPCNPSTTIRFAVPAGGRRSYSLRIYDVQGRLVRRLASGEIGSGPQSAFWDGRNDRGETVGSGVYLYRIEAGPEKTDGKMVIVK